MMKIEIPDRDFYDELTNEFIHVKGAKFKIEHSLLSLAKWEAKWKVPFLHTKLTREQWVDYIRCMTITQNIDPLVYKMITPDLLKQIENYINESQTATTINNTAPQRPHKKEIITAEIIYYWMTAFNIPFECEKWHLSRLLTLCEVCSIKNNAGNNKKMTKSEIMRQNNKLNAARRAAYNSKG